MNKILLLTTVLAIVCRPTLAAPHVASITFDEFATPTGSLKLDVDALLSSFPASSTNEGSAEQTGIVLTTTSGTGSGAVVKFTGDGAGNGVDTITVTCGGRGYKAGDTLTFISALEDKSTTTITLVADDIATTGPVGSLKSLTATPSDADGSVSSVETTTRKMNIATSTSRLGTGAVLSLTGSGSAGISSVKVLSCGSGYRPGDVITIAGESAAVSAVDYTTAADVVSTEAITYVVQAEDIEGYVKTSAGGASALGYRTVEGVPANFVAGTLTGYYVALKKTTTHVQVAVDFTTADGGVTASLASSSGTTTTDAAMADDVGSGTFFVPQDGLNVFKVASNDGTYEFYLMKPDDEVKHLAAASSKRSIAIAYNPAAIGEFTCSAFKGSTSDTAADIPVNRAEVTASSTDSNIIAKSVRTHNIVPEDMFSSFQMSLNGLEPATAYDIYCFHLSHGIISKDDITTDDASLTGVGLVPSGGTVKGVGAYNTLTLTFTHEKTLTAGSATIKLKLYNDYDTAQALTSGTAVQCGAQLTITSGGESVTGATCAANNAELTITLAGLGSGVASGTRGKEVIIIMADGTHLQLTNNVGIGTIVSFDLEVIDHGKLRQHEGWVVTA